MDQVIRVEVHSVIVNTSSPYSINSTCVLLVLKHMQDTIANFRIALDRYKEEVMEVSQVICKQYV